MTRFSIKERHQAIKICEALAIEGCSFGLLRTASERVADLICLTLVALPLQTVPPTVDQWRAAADKLIGGWEPT